jgi:hypothetical protein
MSVEELVEVEVAKSEKQYVCFVKRRTGHSYVPYTEPGKSDTVVVKSLRDFLDHEIAMWLKAGKNEKPEFRAIQIVSFDEFRADIELNGMNSKLALLLGWNYPNAVRLVESEEKVFIMTIHPRFQSIAFSFNDVRDNDSYALYFVEQILSLRGGAIGFEEYDSAKHVVGCRYGGVSAVESAR